MDFTKWTCVHQELPEEGQKVQVSLFQTCSNVPQVAEATFENGDFKGNYKSQFEGSCIYAWRPVQDDVPAALYMQLEDGSLQEVDLELCRQEEKESEKWITKSK